MRRKWIWIVIILAVAAGAAFRAWSRKRKDQDGFEAKYAPVQAARGDIEVTVQSTATIRPQNRLEIKPPLAGRMDEVLVREGDAVQAGQVIATMSSSDRAAVLDAARARGEDALARWKDVYKATPILAPLAGTIIARDVEPGQTVTASDTLFVMSDVLVVEAQVDETDLGQIRTGQVCAVTIDAYPDQSFPGHVSHIAYEAETVQNVTVYNVDVMPDEPPAFIRSGMTANVTFTSQAATDVLSVPAEAVHDEGGGKVVWVPAPDRPDGRVSRPVQTGLTDGRAIEIRSGLAEGDEVLVPRIQSAAPAAAKSNPFMPARPGSRAGSAGARR